MLFSSGKEHWAKLGALCFFGLLYLISKSSIAQNVRLSLQDLAKSADIIAMGRVENVSSQTAPDRSNLTTQIHVNVIEQWKGQTKDLLIINQPGGSAGDITQALPNSPQFSVGEETILFLQVTQKGFYRVVGGRQGKLLVKTDPRTQQQITQDVTGKTQPLEEFVRTLKAVSR